MMRLSALALVALCLIATPALAADEPAADKKAADAAADGAAPVKEVETVTAHAIKAGGKSLKYHATAGTLTIRNTDGKPTASVFYVAYTLDNAGGAKRPVMFLYNGGPGSPSLWLHMGSFAPVRVQTSGPETIPPAPYPFAANPDTLLDKADLVFLDPVGASYSRPLGDAKSKDFWGVDPDADSFARAIQRYVEKNGRWNSPKYILGESYGTTRSGAVAYLLEDRGVSLNGVILLSSIMNYGVRQPGFDTIYKTYLPTYAAVAWYHNKLPNRPADLKAFMDEVRAYAAGPYLTALEKGDRITDTEAAAVAKQLSAYTGLTEDFILRAKLRVNLSRFRKELLRNDGKTVGRYDGRYLGIDTDTAGEGPETDASSTAITGAFVSMMRSYLAADLGYKTEMPYRLSAREEKGFTWDWQHKARSSSLQASGQAAATADTALDLGAAMRSNTHLRVLSLNGWYDMATPFFGTEYDLSHMMLEPAQRNNIAFRYYEGGHMMYLNPDALHQLTRDIGDFIDGK